MSDPYTWIAFG